MKKIYFLIFMLILSQWSCITDQNKYQETDIFEEYETENGFTILHLPPVLFKIVLSFSDESGIESKDLLDKIDVIKLLFFEENEKSLKVAELKESINTKIEKFNYSMLSRIAEENSDISIYIIDKDKVIHEVLVTIVSDSEYVALNFVGELTKDEVMNVYKSINMQKIKDMDN